MVGIYRKIKQILNAVQQYAPILDKFAPGVGALVGSVAALGDDITDGVNNVYEDYSEAKKSGGEYGFLDGVKSFARPAVNGGAQSLPWAAKPPNRPTAAMKSLTKSYGGLHPRLKLKDEN
jgi:hypothetical protein